jgi:hypothetical protein
MPWTLLMVMVMTVRPPLVPLALELPQAPSGRRWRSLLLPLVLTLHLHLIATTLARRTTLLPPPPLVLVVVVRNTYHYHGMPWIAKDRHHSGLTPTKTSVRASHVRCHSAWCSLTGVHCLVRILLQVLRVLVMKVGVIP